jgi:hypothetical protein
MSLKIENVRIVEDAEGLSQLQLKQLYQVGVHFDGQDRSAENRFVNMPITPEAEAEGIDWDDGNFVGQLLHVAEVHEDGVHKYDLWVHHSDNGCLFTKGTTEVLAGRVQSQWMTPDLSKPHKLAAALDAALTEAELF